MRLIDAESCEEWDAARFREEIWQRAVVLGSHGVAPQDRVIFCHGNSLSFFAELFAVWQRGACAICLNPSVTKPEVETIAEFTSAKLLLVSADQKFSVSGTSAADLSGKEKLAAHSGPDMPEGRLDNDALILFTSGTTGVPKGVVHTFRSLLSRTALNASYIGGNALTRTLDVLPTHFGHGLIGNCLTPILAGGSLILSPQVDVRMASRLGELIDEYHVTFMSSVPAMWKLVLKVSRPPKQAMQRVHVGSAPLSGDLWSDIVEWAGTKNVWNMYGITETANWFSGASAEGGIPGDGCIGRPWGGEAVVMTETGEMAASGEGELLLQSPSLMKEYFNRTALNKTAFTGEWFKTGDLARIDKDGVAWLTGRKKYEINRAGIKIQPEDIDILLERHDAIREACAFSIPDRVLGEEVGVAVAMNSEGDFDLEELKIWCGERLTKEKMPGRWFLVDEIPKTDTGKFNRETVANLCLDDEQHVAASTPWRKEGSNVGELITGEAVALETERYLLRTLGKEDATQRYIDWMNDPEIVRYLVSRHKKSAVEDIRRYIQKHDNISRFLFGVFTKESDEKQHIGNLSLRCDPDTKAAILGVMIGDQNYWGQGVVLEARSAVLDFAFENLDIRKMSGGCPSANAAAIYNYRRQNWKPDGIRKEHVLVDGRPVDFVHFAMFRDDWLGRK